MLKLFISIIAALLFNVGYTQLSSDSIKVAEAKAIISYLASDSIKGRGNYTPQLNQVADFISNRFRKAGILSFPGLDGYYYLSNVQNISKGIKDSAGNYKSGNVLLNVIGVLEGKTKPAELVVFCSHYDHVGIMNGEIYNGANDDASGTTALLLLADYYAKRADNERTIVFCAFAGEELGLKGSYAFAEFLKPGAIVTLINIEMIGIPEYGKNVFFITGHDQSDFQKIFTKNIPRRIRIIPEPNKQKNLFGRSDNFPFAKEGVPAHTIMSSDDDDPCYHQPCDDVKRIDVENMVNIIRAITMGSENIINGRDTPSRINTKRW